MRRAWRWLWVCLAVTACASGGAVLAMSSFQDVPIGASEKEVVEILGKPAAVQKNNEGLVEYAYVERIKAGGRNLEERRYILVFKEGRVASKRVQRNAPPAYVLDSYDMQTTQHRAEGCD